MIKQTLEDVYEPKSDLLINGDHVQFNSADEFLSRLKDYQASQFTIDLEFNGNKTLSATYKKAKNSQINVVNTTYKSDKERVVLKPSTTQKEITSKYPFYKMFLESFSKGFTH